MQDVEHGDEADHLPEDESGSAPGLLPDWYMPAAMAGTPLLRGWRRRVALFVVVSFVLISAFGLCSTYGRVAFG